MTASLLATTLRARRIGKGRWSAKCPVHHERTASLSIRDLGDHIGLKCFGCGAGSREVMKALGLPVEEIYYDCGRRVDSEELRRIKRRNALEKDAETLTLKWQSARLLAGLEPDPRWKKLERWALRELQLVRCELEPEAIYREYRERVWAHMNRTQREAVLDRVWAKMNQLSPGLPLQEAYDEQGFPRARFGALP